MLAAVSLLGGVACGGGGSSAAPAQTRTPPVSTTPPAGPCAAVRQTTDLSSVSAACQAAWRPYGVTKVPPADLLDATPLAPVVSNRTPGSVDDREAQQWANAANRDSAWVKWALANGQLSLLRALNAPVAIGGEDSKALAAGATILAADCNLYPQSVALWPVDSSTSKYFVDLHAPTSAKYVLVGTFAKCSSTVVFPDGRTAPIDQSAGGTILAPGMDRDVYPLGEIWFSDSVGSCESSPPPPARFCRR